MTYPTRDKVIPVGLFEILDANLDALESAEQYRMMNAVMLGKGQLDADDKSRPKVKQAWKAIAKHAYPKIPLDDVPTEG